ncbi:Molybdopterin molybdenumtransferase [Paraglaciecola mesophila]|uniref:Molybdopterin molybdenumtransferase n=1 Tax=Paraglaciecola mesophila TaxID=197222 RepID=A0A857JH54_9ALTE|nr:molybdopterin molybdotransferase MoeA [Paraglaciecola mesophila]QHJ10014.1 Molybdopterin molybdenumtransferase [Paraglaciecola mesophila]
MIASCDNPGLLPLSHALDKMRDVISAIAEQEQSDLMQANGRILAKDVISTVNVPPGDNSAMDGYAMIAADLQQTDTLERIGTAFAGIPYSGTVQSGQCVRIMTGAVIPKGADAVVMQENTVALNEPAKHIQFTQRPKVGNSIRRAGEDIRQGAVVLRAGTRLKPAHLSLLASVGVARVSVVRKIKVGLIATGDELVSPGDTLQNGQIFESNRYALHAMLEAFGAQVIDFGIVEDKLDTLRRIFEKADDQCDLVLSCGGVSVGDADYVKDVLQSLGEVNFWKVAIKPGKPFAFGKLAKAWFCGLPGNPVSSYVTFEQLVKPVLEVLSGQTPSEPLVLAATADCDIRKVPGRADYQRGIYRIDENGQLFVSPNGKQGSGVMSSIAHANCYIVLAQDACSVAQGSTVHIQPFTLLAY